MRNKNSQNVKTLVDQENSGSTTVCEYPIVRNDMLVVKMCHMVTYPAPKITLLDSG